jgi:outer membrane lipoprotein-sorting protein
METMMKKFLAAFLMLGLLVSAGAATASAAQVGATNGNSTYVGGNG